MRTSSVFFLNSCWMPTTDLEIFTWQSWTVELGSQRFPQKTVRKSWAFWDKCKVAMRASGEMGENLHEYSGIRRSQLPSHHQLAKCTGTQLPNLWWKWLYSMTLGTWTWGFIELLLMNNSMKANYTYNNLLNIGRTRRKNTYLLFLRHLQSDWRSHTFENKLKSY